ncbi:MAG: cytochrome c oxidase subunit II [Rhizobacter sp.]|nr:cytochrome c oxidase subunit II [Chlorobiales bacterium]
MNPNGTLFMPPQASTSAADVDGLFYFIYYASILFFLLVVGVSGYFAYVYRRQGAPKFTSGIAHNVQLEFTWTVIPTMLVFLVFVWGFGSYLNNSVAPKDALQIKVTGQKWFWAFDYPGGSNSVDTLVVPAGKPVQLTMSSTDVIHSFYVPDFRMKQDVVPNRYSLLWFEAPNEGVYTLFCTEYCGAVTDTTEATWKADGQAKSANKFKQKGHFNMGGVVKVVSTRQYEAFLESSNKMGEGISLEVYGEQLYNSKQCATCHSVNGSAGNGPTWKGIYGRQEKISDGTSVKADDNYIRESILEPGAKVVAGYQNIMPTYQGQLKDKQIDAIIAYMKTIK